MLSRAPLPLLLACLVWPAAGVAAEADLSRSVVTFELRPQGSWWVAHAHVDGGVDGGQDVLASPERPLSARNASQRLANERLEREFIPRMLEAADAGVEPARWQVGLLYLHGWYGVPVDVTRAERILWQAPPDQHPLVAYALGTHSYHAGDGERGERLLLEAYDAGVGQASFWLCSRAAELTGPFGRKHERANALISMLSAQQVADDVDCQLALASLRNRAKRYDEGYAHATQAQAMLGPGYPRRGSVWLERLRGGLESGQLSTLNADELMALLQPIPIPLVVSLSTWLVMALALGVLVWRTWATRARPVGLTLASMWLAVPASVNGLGLMLPLGVKGPLGWWMGAVLSALMCVAALRLRAAPGPYGNTTKPLDRSLVTLAGAMFVAVSAVAFSWDSIHLAVFGSPMKEQFVAGLLRVSKPMDVFWTLLFVAVFVPYVEEVCFRGFFYDALDARWGGTVAVVVSAVFFGLAHVELVDPFSKVPLITAFGLCLGLLRQRSGDLRLGIALHGVNNAVAFLALATS